MPRDSHRSKYDRDDPVRLPVHIVLLITALMLSFLGGGAFLVYASLANHFISPLNTSSSQVQVTASATAHALLFMLALRRILLLPSGQALH
jgi:hypothetical protein